MVFARLVSVRRICKTDKCFAVNNPDTAPITQDQSSFYIYNFENCNQVLEQNPLVYIHVYLRGFLGKQVSGQTVLKFEYVTR